METLTTKKTAEEIGISPRTLSNWVSFGWQVPTKQGGGAGQQNEYDVHAVAWGVVLLEILRAMKGIKAEKVSLRIVGTPAINTTLSDGKTILSYFRGFPPKQIIDDKLVVVFFSGKTLIGKYIRRVEILDNERAQLRLFKYVTIRKPFAVIPEIDEAVEIRSISCINLAQIYIQTLQKLGLDIYAE
jgi:hypothetical protein